MKKTLLTCMAVLALFAIASSATAIVCTIDQRPAATLLVPYFQVAFNSDGTPTTGTGALDTLVAITNASSAPMIAHVSVYTERSVLVLDFNIALTGFDVQSMSMVSVLSGFLPQTPVTTAHVKPSGSLASDVCLRNPAAGPAGVNTGSTSTYMRIRPLCTYLASGSNPTCINTADQNDPTLATTVYTSPAWTPGSTFAINVLGSLDGPAGGKGSISCAPGAAFPLVGTLRGYLVIDHVNYCTISDPSSLSGTYYNLDAIGMENNLMGEVIFTSGAGAPTFGSSTVNIESSKLFGQTAGNCWLGGVCSGYTTQTNAVRERTFYARYWAPGSLVRPNSNTTAFGASNPWNQGFGDEREPLGLKYATRYFESVVVPPTPALVTSYFRVWRASAGNLTNLTGGVCTAVEPTVNLSFYDEDENPIQQAGTNPCPSPCSIPPPSPLNFPYETQRVRASAFTLPAAFGGANVGWMSASFVNLGSAANFGGLLDQAWMDYEFTGSAAFVNASIPGTQLDPTACHPLLIPLSNLGSAITAPDSLTDPITPGWQAGLATNPATATGP